MSITDKSKWYSESWKFVVNIEFADHVKATLFVNTLGNFIRYENSGDIQQMNCSPSRSIKELVYRTYPNRKIIHYESL